MPVEPAPVIDAPLLKSARRAASPTGFSEGFIIAPRIIITDVPFFDQVGGNKWGQSNPMHVRSHRCSASSTASGWDSATRRRARAAFGAAVALFPVLEGAGADADESRKLNLAESEFLTDGLRIGPMEGGAARGFLFSAKNGTAFLQAGGELLEKFVFHGNSVWMMDLRTLSWSGVRFSYAFFG